MLIVQISDSHIMDDGALTYGRAPTAQNLAACVAHINAMVPAPDLVVHTGDVVDAGTLAATEFAKGILDALKCPYFVVPGNHDECNAIKSVFAGGQCPAPVTGKADYVIDDYPVRLIALDSTRKGEAGGELNEDQLAWLKVQLQGDRDKPTLIFMHHPPLKCGILETDEDGFVGADPFGELVAQQSNIESILCGHIHLLTHSRWSGTMVSTAPSMALRLGLDLTKTRPSEFFCDAPGYLLHHFTEQNQLITHAIRVGKDDGPYPF